MTKLLILSDSHGNMETMMEAVQLEAPDAIIHLGDYWGDGAQLHREFPFLPLYQVAGNCDRYSYAPGREEVLTKKFENTWIYMTHGHIQRVKSGLLNLELSARESGAAVALFGHTHQAYLDDGGEVILFNPGSCNSFRGTYGIVEVDGTQVTCHIQEFE